MKYLMIGAAALAISACATEYGGSDADMSSDAAAAAMVDSAKLDLVLAAQPDETKARYQYRNPKETLEFFGIAPGMTVVDTLPGTPGWYAPILISYLGPDGKLIGADYSLEMWPLFGGFATEEWLEKRKTWTADYIAKASELAGEDGAAVDAFVYGSAPAELEGEVDAVLMIRAVHHFNRFEDDGGYFTAALDEAMTLLKPGGVLGVVAHRAAEDMPDDFAEGASGYVKQSQMISFIENAGFEFVAASEINANPADQPTTDDVVWRLPPTLGTSGDDEALKAKMQATGESDRMTLKFVKPE